MIYGGPSQHADDRMMDFYFFRKEKEGMMSESCRSLCTALDSRKHTQVWLREDMSGCVHRPWTCFNCISDGVQRECPSSY